MRMRMLWLLLIITLVPQPPASYASSGKRTTPERQQLHTRARTYADAPAAGANGGVYIFNGRLVSGEFFQTVTAAGSLSRSGKLAEAASCYEKAIRMSPDNSLALLYCAQTLSKIGKLNEALSYLERVLELEADNTDALLSCAEITSRQGRTAECVGYYKQLLEYRPAAALTCAEALRQAGNYGEAIGFYEKAADQKPNNPQIYLDLTDCFLKLEMQGKALSCLRKAAQLSCDDQPELATCCAGYFLRLDEPAQAIKCLEKIVKSKAPSEEAWLELSSAYVRLKQFDKAIKTCSEFKHRFPKNLELAREMSERISILQKRSAEKESEAGTGAAQFLTVQNYLDEIHADHWKSMPLKVYIASGEDALFWRPECNDSIWDSFKTWEEESGGAVQFTLVPSRQTANIICRWTDKPAEIIPFAVGQTKNSKAADNTLRQAEILMLTCRRDKPKIAFSSKELRRICLHEVGHALGLSGHSGMPDDIMYYKAGPQSTEAKLSTRDLNTVKLLYGTAKLTPMLGKYDDANAASAPRCAISNMKHPDI